MAIGIGISQIFCGYSSPYLSSFDLSKLTGGFVSTPNGLIYQCASSGRTVQTGDTVVEGGGVDAVPIGRSLSSNELGLALDGPCVNLVPGQVGSAGWSSNAVIAADTGPGGGACYSIEDDSTGGYESSNSPTFSYASATYFSQLWAKRYSGSQLYCVWRPDSSGAGADLSISTPTGVWTRVYHRFVMTAKTSGVVLFPGVPGAADVGKWGIYNPMVSTCIPSDYYNGTRLGAALGVAQNLAVSGGRVGFEATFYPRAKYTEIPQRMLWAIDANNYSLSSSSSTNIVIGGVVWSVATPIIWPDPVYTGGVLTSVPKVQVWVEGGGGTLQSVIKYRVNGGAVTTIGTSPAPQAAISTTGNVSVMSYLADKTQLQFSSHLTRFSFWKPGKRPSWV
jgi:hypothetical protein